MVKMIFRNYSTTKLKLRFQSISERRTQVDFLKNLEAQVLEPQCCSTIDNFNFSHVGAANGEVLLTIMVYPVSEADTDECREEEGQAEDNGLDRALLMRIRAAKDIAHLRKSYMLMSVPAFHLLPRPQWGTARKADFFWACDDRLFCVSLERRGWRKIKLEIYDAKEKLSTLSLIGQAIFAMDDAENTASGNCKDSSSYALEEMFENERKNHFLGSAKYSKDALCFLDRSCWTDSNGTRVLRPELRGTPSPVWRWSSEWRIQKVEGLTDEEGWMYASGWQKTWTSEKSFGKMVRRRLWVRQFEKAPIKSTLSKRSSSIGHITTANQLGTKSEDNGSTILANILNGQGISKEQDILLDQVDKELFFLSLKETLLALLGKLSPELETMYLHKLSDISPRFRRRITSV